MCRPCLYTAHVYRDDVTFDLGRYYIYEQRGHFQIRKTYCFTKHAVPLQIFVEKSGVDCVQCVGKVEKIFIFLW
jgi:hypothetical protein